ncbi:MAG: SusE domain-containing protein [Muribaculaceae bacterium]|nr:SusE domain-containing protein [Muribaculaceae bacterium]
MKRILKYTAVACAIFGLASCSQDRDPVLQTPTKYVLNVPTMQDQYIDLQAGNVLELVSSQPDYGVATIAQYSAQMSLSEDFATAYDLTPSSKTLARMEIPQSQVALGLMELLGVTDEETFNATFPGGDIPYKKVYFRGVCEIPDVEGSKIISNVVAYNNIKGYFAVPVPGYIYLVGAPEGWAGPTEGNAEHYAPWRLFEPKDAIGSNVYSGVFDIPAGSATFRFYTELTGWENDSYGYQVADEATDFDFDGNTFTSAVVKGKGSFSFPNWPGGEMTITLDMSDMKNITLTCTAGAAEVVVTKYIYLVGSISGWNAPGISNEAAYADYRLADRSNSGIYTGSWHVSAGHVNFRFCKELTDADWDNDTQFGAQADDGDVACTLTNGTYSGSYVDGKGNYAFDIENDGTINITVDTNNSTVTVNFE